MISSKIRWYLLLTLILLCAPVASADSWTFTLAPASGVISGPPGATIGWGYSITNQSTTNWLVLTALGADPFQHATPDSSLFTFPVLAPNTTLTVPYNAATFSGLFQMTWDPTAPVGFTNIGTFVLSGEFWSNDPLNGGSFVSLGLDQSAGYAASVTPVTPIPEPATLLLCLSGLAGIVLRRRTKTSC